MAVATTYKLRDRVVQAVGTDRVLVSTSNLEDVGVQWISHQAAGIAALTVFATLETDQALINGATPATSLNPATNGRWYALPTNFNTLGQPDGSIKTVILPIANDPHAHLMIQTITSTQIPEFSLLVRGKSRG